MDYHPKVSLEIEGHVFSYKLFEALKVVSKTWSQRKASKILGISHTVLNRRIREAEEKLGFKLVITTGAGSGLTDEAIKMLQKYEKYKKRLKEREKIVICGGYISSNLMEIMSIEYGLNSVIYKTSDKEALYLASLDMIDILTLDDPVNAFIHNLDFIPIAYDYMVLFSRGDTTINDINDLNRKNFVEIVDSPQRLAWNTLDDNKIQYKITEEFKSPYEALKFIKNNPKFYTFLSSSLVEGSDILKIDTRHILSSVICNKEDKTIKNFLDFILSYRGQKIVENNGFESINR
ncbi:LysR family transcriptional regulator [Methanobacterium oryzae]|uniref:helix-turn-helix domain-containing protein n=1 Tax=Methanobacterium oryzae TaxID=69540 RepID=UPI003D1FACDE